MLRSGCSQKKNDDGLTCAGDEFMSTLFLPDVTMMMCLLPLSSGSHFFADQHTQSQQSIVTAFFL